MKRIFKLLRIPVIMLLLLFAFSAPSYAIMTDPVVITEDWNGESVVEFTVDTIYNDIIGFAVGTNFSFNFGANVDFGASNPAPSDWVGVAAVKVGDTTWKEVVYNSPPTFTDLPDFINLYIDAFDGYTSAFVFYSTGDPATALDFGFTNGFSGYAFNQDSVFAAFRIGGDVITGETSVIPIPGAAILLFSGLAALIGIRRKQ
ncbi:MAG: hypothetical protein K8S13_13470 [Desulfobacula sp.]|uniref:hypothetical protein n=1 Tax=Desulfobacula sp. TaxID=2593537 RepID=UPI0025C4C27B|nr:hypothetical protein [Desulfobacula sp.]MCD4720849.1 hypothetical protein [Desulfobacula sp.]